MEIPKKTKKINSLNLFNYHTIIPKSGDKSTNIADLLITDDKVTEEISAVLYEMTIMPKILRAMHTGEISSELYITDTKGSQVEILIKPTIKMPCIDVNILTYDVYFDFSPGKDSSVDITSEEGSSIFTEQIKQLNTVAGEIRNSMIGKIAPENAKGNSLYNIVKNHEENNVVMVGGVNGFLNNINSRTKDGTIVDKIMTTTQYLSEKAKTDTEIIIGNNSLKGTTYDSCVTIDLNRLSELVNAYGEAVDALSQFYPTLHRQLHKGKTLDSDSLVMDIIPEDGLYIIKNKKRLFGTVDRDYYEQRKLLEENNPQMEISGNKPIISMLNLDHKLVAEFLLETTRNYHENN